MADAHSRPEHTRRCDAALLARPSARPRIRAPPAGQGGGEAAAALQGAVA